MVNLPETPLAVAQAPDIKGNKSKTIKSKPSLSLMVPFLHCVIMW